MDKVEGAASERDVRKKDVIWPCLLLDLFFIVPVSRLWKVFVTVEVTGQSEAVSSEELVVRIPFGSRPWKRERDKTLVQTQNV